MPTDEQIATTAMQDIAIDVTSDDRWRELAMQRALRAIWEAKGPPIPPGDDGYIMTDFL